LAFHLNAISIPLGPFALSVHPIFESLAYFTGFRIYQRQRNSVGDFLSSSDRLWIVAAAIAGAAIGSKVLGWFENPAETLAHWHDPLFLIGGKTIVGAFLGGTMLVEWTKRRLGICRRTGDLFAVPLALGTAVGRVGCLLAGLNDRTYGIPTSLPWAIDFGDGIARHPTQAYEIVFLLALAWLMNWFNRQPHREGDTFRLFLISYFGWRLLIDFLKPEPRLWGLTSIQWTCFLALLWYSRDAKHILFRRLAANG
jgi:phosphatidylglycerol:prolipoprotein diacylglycerol transferase